ncbi:methyltransferase/ FkbM family domain protein [Synechococcus sp. A18-40]|nr:methyltransferase/ FkbM family domain protein [Synechococcus sp. A18-40]
MNSPTFTVLNSVNEFDVGAKISLFGAGESGQEFAATLQRERPDVEIVSFFDSYREGDYKGIQILNPRRIPDLDKNVEIVVTSIFWNEILDITVNTYGRPSKILSNNLINHSSHLSSYGSFYFDIAEKPSLEARFSRIYNNFKSDLDRQIFGKIFDLRVCREEKNFLLYMNGLVREQRSTFDNLDKYSKHLDLKSVRYAIEGGVYDGRDTSKFLGTLKKNDDFKKLYAFDPFLDSLENSEFFNQIDSNYCEFIPSALWDADEKISFDVDYSNPANSRVVRFPKDGISEYPSNAISAVTVDSFLDNINIPLDLLKLDIEGSEMNALHGAKKSIQRYRPKLAISLYHCREHFLEIPEFILSIHPTYKFSISLTNPTFVDMVIYAQ